MFETIFEKLQEYLLALNDQSLKVFDVLYNKYTQNKKIVEKYEI